MTYSRKFLRLQDALRVGQEHQLSIKAAQLNLALALKKKGEKEVYFELLQACIGINLTHDYLMGGEQHKESTRKHVVNVFLDKVQYADEDQGVSPPPPHSPPKSPLKKLVTKEEMMFAFLCENAAALQLSKQEKKKLDDIIRHFLSVTDDVMPIEEANWQIAQFIYEKLKQLKNQEAVLCSKILVGYLISNPLIPDIATEIDRLQKELPLSFTDYVFYRMSDAAAPLAGEAGRQQRGPFLKDTFWDGMVQLKKRHAEDQPVRIQYPIADPDNADAIVQQAQDHLPRTYDATFNQFSPHLIAELNKHFRQVTDPAQRQQLKGLIVDLNALDANVRELQVQVDVLEDPNRPADKFKQQYCGALKDGVQAKRDAIQTLAHKVHTDVMRLFDHGKNRSTWRTILGIALVLISIAAVAAGIAGLVLVPPAATGLATMALGFKVMEVLGLTALQLNIASGAAIATGIATFAGSIACFFKGAPRSASGSAVAARAAVSQFHRVGMDAADRVEKFVMPAI
jgi:hypothetical protein